MSPYRPCHQQLQAPNWMDGQSTEWSAEYSYVCFVDITVHSWYSWYSNLDQVFYLSAETDMKREIERKEQERKKSPKVEFIPGGVQPPIGASMPKIPALVGVATLPVPAEGVKKETRPNKKSKWDKVDGDVKNPAVPIGHDNLSATVSSALLTSAANVGAGYAAFAQQKRKEAEEKRGDYKSDRRS